MSQQSMALCCSLLLTVMSAALPLEHRNFQHPRTTCRLSAQLIEHCFSACATIRHRPARLFPLVPETRLPL